MNQDTHTQERQGASIVGGGLRSRSSGPGPEVMAASTLEGDVVYNRQGEKLGNLERIMIDVLNGCIAYGVLSRGGVMGFGDKLYAIPWSALTLDTNRRCFVLDASVDRLKEDPGFDKECWPSTADESW